MALPNRQQFSNVRENFSNAVRGSRVDGRQLQAAPSAQQAVPQATPQQQAPAMPPELQRIQAMGLSYQSKLQNDSFLQGIRQQQEKLGAAVQQRQQGYVNSVQQFFNTAPPELRQFLNSPQVMQNINMAYANSQPEVKQMQDLNRQYTEYVQTNYGEEQKRLQELQQQAAPQIEQYQNQMRQYRGIMDQQGGTPIYMGSDFKNISAEEAGFKAPTGLATQGMEFYYNPTTQQKVTVMSGGYEVPEGFVKGNSMGYQDQPQPYKLTYNQNNQSNFSAQEALFNQAQQRRNNLTPEQFQAMNKEFINQSNVKENVFGVQPQNPYASTTAVDSTGTPITGIQPAQQQPTVKPIVDPIRTPIFKPPTPLTPKEQEPVKPIVDPEIEPVRPPIGLATQPTIKPEVDPIKTPTTTSGLGNKPKQRKISETACERRSGA